MTLCLWAHFLEVTSSNPSFHFIHIYFQPVFPFQLVCFQFRGGKCFMGKVQGTIVCCKPARVNFCTWDYTSPWFLTFVSCGWRETSNPPSYQVVTNGKETHVTVLVSGHSGVLSKTQHVPCTSPKRRLLPTGRAWAWRELEWHPLRAYWRAAQTCRGRTAAHSPYGL